MDLFCLFLFWASIAGLAYTFAGYRLLIGLLAMFRPRRTTLSEATPDVCAVVVACNEESRIETRIRNLLASSYPADRMRVLIVSDGSTDETARIVRELADSRVQVLERPSREGKAAGLNAALLQIDAEIAIFSDARQLFAPETIAQLVRHFGDPAVGAVSGSLEIKRSGSNIGRGVDAYWRIEKALRAAESQWDSCIGCTGAVYAIRRSLYTPIPEDTVLDDVVIPMQIACQGHRILHDPTAIAFDSQPLEPASEILRKRRTLAGNFQMLFRNPTWLLPWKCRLWWQLASHKYARLAAPLFLFTALASSAVLASCGPFYAVALAAQLFLYACGTAGNLVREKQIRFLSIPAGFLFLNAAVVSAFFHYLRSKDLHRWQRSVHS